VKFVQRKIPAFAGMTIGFIHIIYFSSWWIYLYLWYNKFKKIMLQQQKQNTLSGEQKVGFTLLLIFALLALSLGFLQIRNTLYKSFAMHQVVPFDIKDQVDTIDALRFRDTDQDGLTDFDELYLYNTSRYLDDSDSDGILDGQEILLGSNPLCPEGEDCTTDIAVIDQGLAPVITEQKPSLTIAGLDAGDELVDLRQVFNNPERIRMLLLENGITENELDQISDDMLLEATEKYRFMAEQGANTQEQLEAIYNGVGVIPEESGLENIITQDVNLDKDNLTDEQVEINNIRNTLIQNGIPAEVLEQISDEQILEYLEQNQ